MEPRKNDWLATLFFSPDKSIQDLADYGITTDNSSLQNRDYYKNIPAIQEAFTDDHGNFDNAKYNKFYDDALYLYNAAEENNIIGNIINTYEYAPGDIFAPIGAKRKDSNASIYQTINPERRSISLTSIGGISDPTMSIREVGQTSNVFNWETQQFENWSPNDKGGLFSGLTMPTLVLAKWENDGTHEWNGRIFTHKRGDLKYNELGDPYYETLDGRDIEGKDLLHYSDVLTTDGSVWNKYDVFDSDGLDKSVGATIAKTAIKIAPMFIPGFGQAYGYFTAALELGELLPLLYKGIAGIAAGDTSGMSSVDTANTIQGYFSRFNSSQSDYARQAGFFTLENIGEIAQMASMQLFQQKAISKIPGFFDKNKKIIDGKEILSPEAIKWGRGLSFAYMSGTSAQHSYEAFKEAGASDRAAGLGMFATMWAFYGLMSNNYFNYEEVLFGGSQLSKSAIKKGVIEAGEEASKKLGLNSIEAATATPEGAAKWVIEAKNKIVDWAKKQNPSSILSTSYKEGIEETMEEVFTDGVKGFFSGLNALGLIDKDTKYDFGFSVEDMATRYFTSFIGGGIGGAMFGLHNKFDGSNKEIDEVIKENKEHFQKIVYLFRNGKEQEVRNITKQLWNQGKFASKNLSGYEFEVMNSSGSPEAKYKPAKQGESQNDLIYKELTKIYDRISSIITEEGLNISDEEIENIISARPDLSRDDAVNIIKNYRASSHDTNIFSLGIHTQALQDINSLATDILKTKVAMESMLSLGATDPKTNPDVEAHIKAVKKSHEYQKLESKLEQLRTKRDAILSGKYNDYYMGLMHFAGRTNLAQLINNKYGLHQYTTWKYGKYYDALSPEEQYRISIEYGQYSAIEKDDIIKAYDLFNSIQNSANPLMKSIALRMSGKDSLHSGYDEYFVIQQNINAEITENETKINELKKALPEGETTSEEIQQLEAKNIELKALLESRQFEGRAQIINLSEKGKELLHRNTPEYAESYLNYLSYILQNGLYLDKEDADLHYILQTYVANFSPERFYEAWKQYIINKEGNYDDTLDEWYNPIANAIADTLNALRKGDINTAIDSLNSIMTGDQITILESMVTDFNSQEFWDMLLPFIGSYRLSTYLNELSRYKSLIQSSPVYELIAHIAKELNISSDLISLLQHYQKEFFQAETVHDFIIQNAEAINDLKKLHQIINIANALILAGSKDGYNHSINPYRTALNKEVLSEFTDMQIYNMTQDLSLINTQVETLIAIAEKNNAQKLREQKDIEINMKSKFLDILVGTPSAENPDTRSSVIKDLLKTKLHIDIDDIISKLNLPIPDKVSEQNIKEVNTVMTAIETAIYEQAVSLGVSTDDIVEVLFEAFNKDNTVINGQSTKISKNNQTIITDYDQLIYFATIFGAPTINFNNRVKSVLESEGYDKAPLFSQEYATRIIYSFVNNTELFNKIVAKIKTATSSDEDIYIKNKTGLNNIMFILGSAGVGKTTGVAKLATAILENPNVTLIAPTQTQVDNLASAINSTVTATKVDIREKLLGIKNWSRSQIKTVTETINGKTTVKSVSFNGSIVNNPTDLKSNKIMIIDEITLFNRLDLELLSQWATENGIKIIALGDPIQNAIKLTISDIYDNYSGLEDTWHIKAPRLTAPMRPSNIGKYDNTVSLSVALEHINDQYSLNPTWDDSQIDEYTNKYLPSAPITLKYFEDNATFYGDRIVSGNISQYIEKFKKLKAAGNSIVVITDDTSGKYLDTGFEIIHPNNVQGREFDYVIVDVDLTRLDLYNKLRSFYTYTQRSTKGTIIVNNGGLPPSISSIADITASYNISIEPKSIEEFKKWKLDNIYTGNDIVIEELKENEGNPEPQIEEPLNQPNTTIDLESASEEPATVVENDQTTSIIDEVPQETTITTPLVPELPNPEQRYDVNVAQPNKILCSAKEYFTKFDSEIYQVYSEAILKYFGISRNISTEMHLLRAWFLYGHHKNGESFNYKRWNPGLETNKLKQKIHNLLSNNPNPRFIIENHVLVVELHNEDEIIKIPLLYVNNIESGEIQGDIEINTHRDPNAFGNHIDEIVPVTVPPHMQKSAPMVLNMGKANQTSFAYFHSGQTFMAINADPFADNWEEEFFTFTDNAPTTHIPSVQIIKAKRTFTWTQLKEHIDSRKTFKVDQSIIYGSTVGGIIALAYKLDQVTVTKNLANYLSKQNRGLKIIIHTGTLPNPFIEISSIDEFTKQMSELSNIDFSIQLTYYTSNGIQVNKIGEIDLKTALYGFTKWGELEEAINNSKLYKHGIHGNDHIPGNQKGWYPISRAAEMFQTDFDTFYGNDFLISINPTEETESDKLIKELNNQLKALGFNNHIASLDTVQTTLDSINASTLSNLSSPKFTWLRFDGNKIIKEYVSSLLPFIASRLNMLVDGDWENQGMNINFFRSFINENTCKFEGFYVTLPNGSTQYYVLFRNADNTLDIRQVHQDVYSSWSSLVRASNIDFKNYPTVGEYVNKIINNEDVELKTAKTFSQFAGEFGELSTLINEYLISKLKNNEC